MFQYETETLAMLDNAEDIIVFDASFFIGLKAGPLMSECAIYNFRTRESKLWHIRLARNLKKLPPPLQKLIQGQVEAKGIVWSSAGDDFAKVVRALKCIFRRRIIVVRSFEVEAWVLKYITPMTSYKLVNIGNLMPESPSKLTSKESISLMKVQIVTEQLPLRCATWNCYFCKTNCRKSARAQGINFKTACYIALLKRQRAVANNFN